MQSAFCHPQTFAEQMQDKSYEKSLLIALFDLVFFILITTIGLNIIFGIIVDTFSELRDSKVSRKPLFFTFNFIRETIRVTH